MMGVGHGAEGAEVVRDGALMQHGILQKKELD